MAGVMISPCPYHCNDVSLVYTTFEFLHEDFAESFIYLIIHLLTIALEIPLTAFANYKYLQLNEVL